MNAQIRILIADDHPVVRDGLAAMLATQPDFHVIGEAADGAETVEKAVQLQPDVVLLDLEMPGMDGVEALHALRAQTPQVRAIVFTAFDTDERILRAIKAGAQGYLLKGVPREDLFQAVRVVSQGGSLIQPVVASRLLRQIGDRDEPVETLTRREKEVLFLMAEGKANKEIAEQLVISERTVKFHVSAILRKLDAANRTEAARAAARMGLLRN